MPAKHEIQAFQLPGWVGGLNNEADPYKLEPTESPDALNVDFGITGEVSKRLGYETFAADAAVSDHLFNWRDNLIFVRAASDIFYLNVSDISTDSTFNLVAVSDARSYAASAVSMNDKVYLTRHGAGAARSWDGTTWASVTQWDGTDSTGVFPAARAAVEAHNRIFAANVRMSGGATHPSRVFISDVILPESWKALSYIDVDKDNGQEITGMAQFGDQIIVFKDHSVHALVGTNETEFDVYPVDNVVGTTAPGTITNLGLNLFFFDPERGVYQFDGATFYNISEHKINTHLLDGVNKAQIHKARGFAYRNRYFLSVPWGADTYNSRTFVYDPRIQAWTEYDYGMQAAVEKDLLAYAVGVSNTNDVREVFKGDNDAAAAINAYMKTGWMSPGSPSMKHRLRRLDLTMSALGDHNIDIIMRRDFSVNIEVQKSVNTDLPGTKFGSAVYGVDPWGSGAEQLMYRDAGWGTRWRSIQLEFAERTTGLFQINRGVMMVSFNERPRGGH